MKEQIPMIYYYEVFFWDEFADSEFGEVEGGRRRTSKGIILGETMGAAIDKINRYYGPDNIFTVKVWKCLDEEGNADAPMDFKHMFDMRDKEYDLLKPSEFFFF